MVFSHKISYLCKNSAALEIANLLLSIFDQANRQENHHIMNVKETDFPEKFRPIIRRLQAAIQEKEIQDIMTVEDDFLSELNEYENRIAEATKQKEEAQRKQEEAQRKQEEAEWIVMQLPDELRCRDLRCAPT